MDGRLVGFHDFLSWKSNFRGNHNSTTFFNQLSEIVNIFTDYVCPDQTAWICIHIDKKLWDNTEKAGMRKKAFSKRDRNI